MDINTLRSAATLLGFIAFCLLVWRVWRQPQHPAAALPLADEDVHHG